MFKCCKVRLFNFDLSKFCNFVFAMDMCSALFHAVKAFLLSWILLFGQAHAQPPDRPVAPPVLPGAYQMDAYLPLLQGKRAGVIVNQTSEVNGTPLLDTLLARGVQVKKIFVPEHGFRGQADAGASIKSGVDAATGLPVISLYGQNKKPSAAQLEGLDILIYDLQDVGVRFYTYISTLQYCMEAAAENGKTLLVLDRPNPNGHYIDGPVLDTSLRSFVGMQPIPVVYGMTPGEYAQMLKGEGWFEKAHALRLEIIPCKNYDHLTCYELPVAPSPNLKTQNSIYLYPSLCFFEGTVVSVGRGTSRPFEQWGHPAFEKFSTESFRPRSMTGATQPPYEGQNCYGRVLGEKEAAAAKKELQLQWLIEAYNWYGKKESFFNNFFEKLAGTRELRRQIRNGVSAEAIRQSWQPGLKQFNEIRRRYLLYPDFR